MLGWLRRKAARAPQALAGAEIATDTVPSALPPPAPVDWAPTVPMPVSGPGEPGARRTSELRRLAALQARGDAAYPYVVETAARICGTPLAGISLLDGGVLVLKAAVGVTPADQQAIAPWCRRAMAGAGPVTVLSGATMGGGAAGRPLRFYAGAPLAGGRGVPEGVVWVADVAERGLSPVQLRTLELLARQTTLLMESRAP
ncbi:MAG: hypothetical protein QM772_18180 [Ottowia sp.]|uniref:hypothetical protein n=1 Tax=Ottowia sp. TaxID=1898956 RepID=UPI0039E5173C